MPKHDPDRLLAGFLGQNRRLCYYPSCGNRFIWPILNLDVGIFVFSDYFPKTSAARVRFWTQWKAGLKNHGYEVDEVFSTVRTRVFKIEEKWGFLFFQDNNQVLERIRSSGLKIDSFVGICDGCAEGGNYECVHSDPFLGKLLEASSERLDYFTDEFGNELLGIVKSVSLGTVKVVCDKGRSVVESFPAKFSQTERTLTPAASHPALAPFRVRMFKEQAGHGDGPAFVAVIQKNGVDSIRVVGDGWGGPCECQPMNMPDLGAPREFEEAVGKWGQAAGKRAGTFGVESWIEWSWNFQPYGLEAAEYFAGNKIER